MAFHRRLRRNTAICIALLAGTLILKWTCPAIGQQIGGWVAGEADNRVSQAISCFLASLKEGEGVHEAVEVFCDAIRDSAQD